MKNGGAEGNRTLDLCIANAALSQLSYRPINHQILLTYSIQRQLQSKISVGAPGFLLIYSGVHQWISVVYAHVHGHPPAPA